MYAVIDHDLPSRPGAQDALTRELHRIMELRGDAIGSRELLYSSPLIRALIEDEIPRLVSLCARRAQGGSSSAVGPVPGPAGAPPRSGGGAPRDAGQIPSFNPTSKAR